MAPCIDSAFELKYDMRYKLDYRNHHCINNTCFVCDTIEIHPTFENDTSICDCHLQIIHTLMNFTHSCEILTTAFEIMLFTSPNAVYDIKAPFLVVCEILSSSSFSFPYIYIYIETNVYYIKQHTCVNIWLEYIASRKHIYISDSSYLSGDLLDTA